MKKIHLLMLVCSCIIVLFSCAMSAELTDYEEVVIGSLSVECMTDGQTVELTLWKDESDGAYYLFLPSWFAGAENELTLCYEDWKGILKINDVIQQNKSIWIDSGEEKVHKLEVYDKRGECHLSTTLQVLASENIPALFVTVEAENDLLKIEEFENKKYIEAGSAIMVDEEGKFLWQEELSEFKVRGNLTATYDKKPFSFSFYEPREVLGMEPAMKWNLLANSTDGSYIRNKIIRDLAYESIDAYEPEGEFAELYLNGVYQGLYLLTEAVEIADNRIEIDADENWFVEMELDFRARNDETQIITDRGQIFIVHSEIGVSKEDLEKIASRLNDVESALFAEDGVSEISGKSLEELIDLESFAEAWLIEELSGDHDIGITSQFAYALKDEDSLWHSGPAWDFDGIMTNVNTPMYGVPESLTSVIWMSRPKDNNNQNRWMSAMWNYAKFREIVKEKYISVFREHYANELNYKVDEYVSVVRRSAVLDAFRWQEERWSWWFTFPEGLRIPEEGDYSRFDTLDTHIEIIKDFMSRKLIFLDKLWIEERDFCVVEVRNPATFLDQGYNQTLYYWVERGTAIERLPNYESEGFHFEGYYDVENGEFVADGTIIDSDRVIEGIWSEEVSTQ